MASNLTRLSFAAARLAVPATGSASLAASRPAGIRLFSSSKPEESPSKEREEDAARESQSKREEEDTEEEEEEGEAESEEVDAGEHVNRETGEIGGPRGPEPTRYGDWEQKGRCSDF